LLERAKRIIFIEQASRRYGLFKFLFGFRKDKKIGEDELPARAEDTWVIFKMILNDIFAKLQFSRLFSYFSVFIKYYLQ
jgi:hypothetical protein